MRIVHISSFDRRGGAPRAAYRLNFGLRKLGHDSTMFVGRGDAEDPAVTVFAPARDFVSRARRRLWRSMMALAQARYRDPRRVGYESFSDGRSQYGDAPQCQLPSADILNLHWITGFIDYKRFFSAVPSRYPLVWTLHDMNAFTGGCHYDFGCERYLSQCGACPQLGSGAEWDISRQVWERKRASLAKIPKGRLHLVAPSRWIAAEARRSRLLARLPLSIIPNGLNTDDFAPRDKGFARHTLGVPQGAKVVLFAANSGVRRKGFAHLVEAIRGLTQIAELLLLSVGGDIPAVDDVINHRHLGFTSSDRLLSLVYSAADLLVAPSLQDNLPNTILESMACGTPVVGFDAGGIPDLVRPGVTGSLVVANDIDCLRREIANLLQNSELVQRMSESCRRVAVSEYSIGVQAKRYCDLYREVLHAN